ncbi:hypothetical protein CANARDRAFT_202186 [[Candida] arabinofermentans NRRL YB-2248]|uniref:Purine-cytosine permease n=1 Tax=[Candida] arabinofermentans NRRL YB-2248 TaxID=983967 RepID=A0A1E4SWL9_9ASCO|nr:hypothetical protein CANARDRAFT_202186 [[Candida] arabinofermentans NRRL YB-2248]
MSYSDQDIEKKADDFSISDEHYGQETTEVTKTGFGGIYANIMEMFHGETRGIERVPEEEKTQTSIFGCASMWLSANLVIATFSLGALSYSVFGLDFGTSVLTIIFFNLLGGAPVAFFSIHGAKTGLRQMILSRFLVGDLAMRIFSLINVICCVGWGAVNIMSSAQLLHIVNNFALPPWAGCLILVLLTIIVTFFGYNVIHSYEKYAWIPNVACFIAIIARLSIADVFVAGLPNGDGTFTTWGSGKTFAGSVLSFGSTVFGFAAGWTTFAADYTTYMKSNSNPYKIFFGVWAGLCLPLIFTMTLGAAAVTGIKTNETYATLYGEYSIGGLVYAILCKDSLGKFGEFLSVLLALSTVCNNIPNMYSIGLGAQALWSKFAKVPRVVWTVVGNALTLAICIPAYYEFESVMHNFMNLIGYYLAIYDAIALSEHFIYLKGFSGYDLDSYMDKSKLNPGFAGTFAFCCGVAGVVIGMNQTWYIGVLAEKIGLFGGDIGFELAFGFAFIAYNATRTFERNYFGR